MYPKETRMSLAYMLNMLSSNPKDLNLFSFYTSNPSNNLFNSCLLLN